MRIPAVLMRGGTSRGLFFHASALPADARIRDQVILYAMGSPDPGRRQVDGVGGATSSTSKAVIIAPSSRADSDVDYLFAQVGIDSPQVDYTGNCGNLSAAVGPFAIEEGLVAAADGVTTVRIWQVNTRKRIIAHVPTRGGNPVVAGDFQVDGVPRPGAKITLEFLDPGGSVCPQLLPTGRVTETLVVPGVGEVVVTLLDAANPVVFVPAQTLGLSGTELPEQVDTNPALLAKIEAIRAHGAVAMGVAASPEEATATKPALPKIVFAGPPRAYVSRSGTQVSQAEIDFVARAMSMGRLHQTYPATVAVATVVAALVPGTVVNQLLKGDQGLARSFRFGHTSGTIQLGAAVAREGEGWVARASVAYRTARRLMEGAVLVPEAVLAGNGAMGEGG